MKRVVVTGMGAVSSIGNHTDEIAQSLKDGRSGIEFMSEYDELGFRSRVAGPIRMEPREHIDKRHLRFMGEAAAWCHISMNEAIEQAQLSPDAVSDDRVGLVMGSGGGSPANQVQSADLLRQKGVRRVGPFMVPRCMTSTVSACLSTTFGIRGVNYSISSACATSAHCIGHAADLIRLGRQDIVFAGGGDEVHWTLSVLFDGMGALSSKRNDDPTRASRPYDADRDGFVISGGGGVLVLEELEHAKKRGAPIIAELVGYGASSDGSDMVQPSGEGAVRCMNEALQSTEQPVDYVNTHGTSTPVGDISEIKSLREVFGENIPPFASTKSLTGHGLGAAGVHEAIYSLLMMRDGFISASANIDELDGDAEGMPVVRERQDGAELNTVMSNSFGFGGTNATLVFSRPET